MTSTTLLALAPGYLLFLVMNEIAAGKKSARLIRTRGLAEDKLLLILTQCVGIVSLGIMPFIVCPVFVYQIANLQRVPNNLSLGITGIAIFFACILGRVQADKHAALFRSTVRCETLDRQFITNYFLVRVIFLVAYELWFRGYFLMTCVGEIGVPAAIAINIVLYSLLHRVNGRHEMIACLPIGVLFCCLCIWQHSALPAIGLHLAMALGYESRVINRINNSFTLYV